MGRQTFSHLLESRASACMMITCYHRHTPFLLFLSLNFCCWLCYHMSGISLWSTGVSYPTCVPPRFLPVGVGWEGVQWWPGHWCRHCLVIAATLVYQPLQSQIQSTAPYGLLWRRLTLPQPVHPAAGESPDSRNSSPWNDSLNQRWEQALPCDSLYYRKQNTNQSVF